MSYAKIKRFIDILLSVLGIAFLLPLLLLVIIAIKLESRGPIFFKQNRVGIYKKYFYILKFRTMYINTPKDQPTHLLKKPEQWITKVGAFLRKTSLDELPQLVNILKGDMSLIGPRPALWNQYDLINERDKYDANNVYPGLTGLAQISGRDELKIEDKAKLDGVYSKNVNFLMDAGCFFKTILNVLKFDGIVEGVSEPQENFKNEK